MKLQKLLKKLALPVFALVVVGMLAACSSPASSSSGGGSSATLDNDTEYTIVFDESLDEKDIAKFTQMGISDGDKVPGVEINEGKSSLEAMGYIVTPSGTTVIIKKKPASNNTPSGNGTTYTLVEAGMTYTITPTSDTTYTASITQSGYTMTVEEGTYVVNGDKVTITPKKQMGQSGSLETLTPAESDTYTRTFEIGANNVLTPVYEKDSASGSSSHGPGPSDIPASWYKIYYKGDLIDAMPANMLDSFAFAAGLEDSDYTKDDTNKTISLTDEGFAKAKAYSEKAKAIYQ